jgi:hypothetical protein
MSRDLRHPAAMMPRRVASKLKHLVLAGNGFHPVVLNWWEKGQHATDRRRA